MGEPPTDERAWFTPREAAQLLGIPLRDLYRLVDQGDLSAVRHGNVLCVPGEEVAARREPPCDPSGAPVRV